MGRGLERQYIFESSIDKRDFLARFGDSLDRRDAQCLAWALMSNHYHFLLRVGQAPLSKLMASALGGYASSYNRRHRRCGYVFQNRYKSILVDKDSYFLELVRYIHLNPVVACMVRNVDELEMYPWAGHAGMLNKHRQEWHSVDATLTNFGSTPRRARSAYRRFLKKGESCSCSQNTDFSGGGLIRSYGGWQGIGRLRKEHISCIGDERILGPSEFIESALKQDNLSTERSTALAKQGWDIDKLAEWVCDLTGISRDKLSAKARGGNLSEAKAILCYLGKSELGLTIREISDFLSISQPSTSIWVKKGEPLCKQ
ncbi:MAG: transposase, partial [Gammaproteobacteria bacterium]|nr:transposase [Gammaproteobacteria bacterium]